MQLAAPRALKLKRLVIALLISAGCGTSLAAQQSESILPLEVMVTNQPQPTKAGGRWYLVYELHLTNFYTTQIKIAEVAVMSASRRGHELRKYSDQLLERNLKTIGPRDDSVQRRILEPGRRAVLFIWAPIENRESAPDSLFHRVVVTLAAAPDSQIIIGGRTRVAKRNPAVIDPPLRGTGWLSYYGACPNDVPDHDRLAYPRGGLIRMPQRYAVDFVRFGNDGRVFHGDSSKNENYYAYRQPVYSIARGIVRLVINDVTENVPPEVTGPRTRHTIAGNVIVLDIGNGRFAVYGHLRPGSIRVREGQGVASGAQIAEVGNTGNSTGPHLHFHIIDAPATGAGEGLAFMYRRYRLISDTPIADEIIDEGKVWRPGPWSSSPRAHDLPTCGSVVDFIAP